jgi:hypothetical protein
MDRMEAGARRVGNHPVNPVHPVQTHPRDSCAGSPEWSEEIPCEMDEFVRRLCHGCLAAKSEGLLHVGLASLFVNSHQQSARVCPWNPIWHKNPPPSIPERVPDFCSQSNISTTLHGNPYGNHRSVLFLDARLSWAHGEKRASRISDPRTEAATRSRDSLHSIR